MKVLLHGRSNNSRDIELYIGKDLGSLRKVSSVRVNKFIGQLTEFNIEKTDVAANESFVFAVKSLNTLFEERFSIGFTEITYPQEILMNGETSKVFNFSSDNTNLKKVSLSDIKSSASVYDITNEYEPKIVTVSSGEFLVQGQKGKQANILVTESAETVKKRRFWLQNFKK
jgi:rRNA maturation endonuclease Nob1